MDLVHVSLLFMLKAHCVLFCFFSGSNIHVVWSFRLHRSAHNLVWTEKNSTLASNDSNVKTLDKRPCGKKENSMEFHLEKSQILRITNEKFNVLSKYITYGIQQCVVNKAKYWRVAINDKLIWKYHIINTSMTAKFWVPQKKLVRLQFRNSNKMRRNICETHFGIRQYSLESIS